MELPSTFRSCTVCTSALRGLVTAVSARPTSAISPSQTTDAAITSPAHTIRVSFMDRTSGCKKHERPKSDHHDLSGHHTHPPGERGQTELYKCIRPVGDNKVSGILIESRYLRPPAHAPAPSPLSPP